MLDKSEKQAFHKEYIENKSHKMRIQNFSGQIWEIYQNKHSNFDSIERNSAEPRKIPMPESARSFFHGSDLGSNQ